MARYNIKIIINFISVLLLFLAGFMLLCVPVSYFYEEDAYTPIALSSLITFILGILAFVLTKDHNKTIRKREGYLIVTFGWIFMVFFGGIPFFVSFLLLPTQTFGENELSITNSFFESMSGFTTTGSTILKDIEIMPKGLLLWRSITHWIGGMGIIVLTIAILPLLGIGGMQLFVAEAPGISADKLHPRISETAKRLWFLYVLITVALFVLLWLAGMNVFDAINHAMSTMSTGGFSTKNASIAFWENSPAIQYLITFFMFIAGVNFVVLYMIFRRKNSSLLKNEEFRFYTFLILIVSLISTIIVYSITKVYNNSSIVDTLFDFQVWEESFRYSIFQVLTVVTTTGFISYDYTIWTPALSIIFFALMFSGGMAGSTAGGVKIVRHMLMIKNIRGELKRLVHPNAVIPIRFNGRSVDKQVISHVLAFFMTYLLIFIFGAIVLAFLDGSTKPSDFEMTTYLGTSISALGNVGPAFGKYNPVNNFSDMTDAAKWFCSFLMLLGRLELFTVFILFTSYFWKR